MGLADIATLESKVASQLTLANLGFSPYPVLHSRYRIEEIRGRGARGLVVRATDTSIGRRVALKVYPPLSDRQPSGEVSREAQALGRLEHPNVVRIYDVGEAELALEVERMTVRFMCIEYVEGTDLRAWASKKGVRRSARIRALLAAAEGLAAAHEAGMVHRDVKPENIMVEHSHHIKVVDFGLAGGLYSESGGAVGTPEYMAPEAREGQAFAEADQFSFAMVAWELLLGCRPYDSTTESYKPPQQETFSNATSLPRYLRVPLERALAFSPSARHRDMRALIRAIRRGQSLRRLAVGAGIGGVSLACVGLGLLAWQGVPELPTGGSVKAMAPDSADIRARAEAPEPAIEAAANPAIEHAAKDPEIEHAAEHPAIEEEAAASSSNEEACSAASGTWFFNTAVSWANNMQFRPINGYYELELDHQGECRFLATVRKTGSTRHTNTPAEIRSDRASIDARVVGGRVQLLSEFRLQSRKYESQQYMLAFELDGTDSMVGAYWHRASGAASRDIAGVLRGERSQLLRDISAWEVEVPCALECIPGCADETSTQACVERCADGKPAMPCGAPSAESSAPERAQTVIGRVGRANEGGLSGKQLRRCGTVAGWLEGDWTLFVAGDDPADFEISAEEDCGLTFSGALRGTGDVDSRGTWTLLVADEALLRYQLVPWFALTGWGPAFGVTREGKPAAAYRKR